MTTIRKLSSNQTIGQGSRGRWHVRQMAQGNDSLEGASQLRNYDVVLGGQNPPPVNGV